MAQETCTFQLPDLFCVHKHTTDVPQLQPFSNVCRACSPGKAHKLLSSSLAATSSSVEDILYSDAIGSLPLLFSDGHRYEVLFLNNYSRFCSSERISARAMGLMCKREFATD